MNRRRRRYEEEERVELQEVLEPYRQTPATPQMDSQPPEEYPEAYAQYEDPYMDEYSDVHDEADSEGRFRIAMGFFDLISIFVGIVVILILVAMLVSLISWLRDDILHSALLMQSGLR